MQDPSQARQVRVLAVDVYSQDSCYAGAELRVPGGQPPPLSLYPTGCACTSVMCEAHGRGLSPPGVDAALPGKGPSVVT